jgi:hypothetical protein
MAIIHNSLSGKFSISPNEVFDDNKTSAIARFILLYLFSKGPSWKVNNSDVMNKVGIKSEETIAKYWKELENAGWIKRKKVISKGKFLGFDYELSTEKTDPESFRTGNEPTPKVSVPVKNRTGKNGGHINTNSYSNTNIYSNTELEEKEILKNFQVQTNENFELEKIEMEDSVTIPFNIQFYQQKANTPGGGGSFTDDAIADYEAQIEANKKIHSASLKKPKKEPLHFSTSDFMDFDNPDEMVKIWTNWTTYKHREKGFVYKVHSSQNIAIDKLCTLSGGKSAIAKEIVANSIAGTWSGFFELKQNYQQQSQKPNNRAEVIDPNKYG